MAETKSEKKPLEPLSVDEHHKEPLQIQILEKMSQLMTAGFGVMAAFAWRDALARTIVRFFGEDAALWIYYAEATFVTLIAVIAGLWIANTTHKVKAALGHGHPPTTA